MLVKEVLDRSISLLGLQGNELQRKALLNCFNDLYEQLSLVVLNLRATEHVEVQDGRLLFSQLSHPMREVLRVTQDGHRVPFQAYGTFLILNGIEGWVDVTYLYRARPLTETDTPELPPRFAEYPLAVGTAGEYCYRMGLVDEAKFFQARYQALLSRLTSAARAVIMPIKRWL